MFTLARSDGALGRDGHGGGVASAWSGAGLLLNRCLSWFECGAVVTSVFRTSQERYFENFLQAAIEAIRTSDNVIREE